MIREGIATIMLITRQMQMHILLYQLSYHRYPKAQGVFLSYVIEQFQFNRMLLNKPKDGKNPYQASLPKTVNGQYNAISTRCISVAKPSTGQHLLKPIVPPKQLTYYLGKGNNEGLVRRVLSRRATWVQSEDSTNAFLNFKWQQDQKGMKYERLIESGLYRGLVNQFEFHQALSNKEMLFRNLEQFCHKNGLDIWRIVPPTYLLNVKDECNMMLLKQFTDTYEKHYPERLKSKTGTQTEAEIQQAKLKLRKIFCNSNLKKILGKAPPIGDVFLNENGEYLWIVKPTFLNRGRGIQVFSRLQALFRFVSDNLCGYVERGLRKDTEEDSPQRVDYVKRNSQQIQLSVLMRDPANREVTVRQRTEECSFDGNKFIRVIPRGPAIIRTDRFLVQKYLQKPMLIMNRKFDIRIWVLVTHGLKGFVFREGYVRLSSLEYACTDSPTNNTFMHLTNNAVQKFSQGYGNVADGNQLSFSHLRNEMQKLGLSFDDAIKGIHQDIRISLKATAKLLNANNRKFSFQIFGYDFMIDETGFPWLIEVNTNPCIEESSKLLQMLLPRMLDDAFRMTLDPLFYGSVSNTRFKVNGYPDTQNMWLNLNIDK